MEVDALLQSLVKPAPAIALATKPLEIFKDPANEFDPVYEEIKVFARVRDLVTVREPANEEEPRPNTVSLPKLAIALATKPLEIFKEPANELEPVYEEIKVFARVRDLVMPTLPVNDDDPAPVKAATVPTKPLEIFKEPANELEPVKVEFKVFVNFNILAKSKDPAKELEAVDSF